MTSKVAIIGVATTAPPTFLGRYGQEEITIGLDSSAVLKLVGNARFEALPTLLSDDILGSPGVRSIERAVERLIELRGGEATDRLTVSALDLD